MAEKKIKKSTIFLIVGLILFFAALWLYTGFTQATSKEKKHIENVVARYMEENHPELVGRLEYHYGDSSISFHNKRKHGPAYMQDMEWWDGVWMIQYKIDGDPDKFFLMELNRKGDKIFFDGYEEHYLKGGILLRRKAYEFRDFVQKAFEQDKYDAIRNKTDDDFNYSVVQCFFYCPDEETGNFVNPDSFSEPYTGPVLDINKEYTYQELAKEYGLINFHCDKAEKTPEAIYECRVRVKDFVQRHNIDFKLFTITVDTFYGVYNMPAETLFNEDFEDIIMENAGSMFEYAEKMNRQG